MHILLKLLTASKRVLADRQGVTAVEFALVSPILIILMFGAIEMSNLLIADTKLRAATAGVADLITQKSDGEITTTNLQMANYAARLIMAPLPSVTDGQPRFAMIVTNYATDSDGNTTVAWTRLLDPSAPTTPTLSTVLGISPPNCGPATLPDGLAVERNQVIGVTSVYEWRPWFGFIFNDNIRIAGQNYSMPRFSASLTANFGGSGGGNCTPTP
jgi:Flp pilus assembly protein TadG